MADQNLNIGDAEQDVIERLHRAALAARDNSVSNYSGFAVGAAIEADTGEIIGGCNIENATFGLTVCAERVAIWKALSEGFREFRRAIVVADTSHPTPPCGACRQILWEFAPRAQIFLADLKGVRQRHLLSELIPLPFDGRTIDDSN